MNFDIVRGDDGRALGGLAAAELGAEWAAEAMTMLMASPGVFAVVSRSKPETEPDGAAVFRVAADEVELLAIAVARRGRRRGLGRLLIEAGLAEAARAGAVRAFLEVATGNEAARALYARAGFAEVGRREAYYADGGDALVLARDLAGGP